MSNINKNGKILAIDFGGMSVKYFLFENEKELANVVSQSAPLMEKEKLIADIKDKFTSFEKQFGKIEGIAMSFNSPVLDGKRVRWGFINGLWEYFDIKDMVERAGIISADKIRILNDAKAAGYAELKVGAAVGETEVVMLTYGTAIGGAAFVNGQVINGPFGLGAELSNPILGYDGKSYDSLKIWCEFGSMSFVQDRYRELTGRSETGKDIFDFYDAGDKAAKETIEALYRGMGIHIFNACYTYGPSSIIIGGGISNRKELVDELMVYIKDIEKRKGLLFPCQVKLAKAGNKAGALGAYYYFLDNI